MKVLSHYLAKFTLIWFETWTLKTTLIKNFQMKTKTKIVVKQHREQAIKN